KRVRDLVFRHLAQYLGQTSSKLGKIDMAMGIDIHPAIVRVRSFTCLATDKASGNASADNDQITLDIIQFGNTRHLCPAHKPCSCKQLQAAHVMREDQPDKGVDFQIRRSGDSLLQQITADTLATHLFIYVNRYLGGMAICCTCMKI